MRRGNGVGVDMRNEVATQRLPMDPTLDVHCYPRKTSAHWLQLAGEVRRVDLAVEQILIAFRGRVERSRMCV